MKYINDHIITNYYKLKKCRGLDLDIFGIKDPRWIVYQEDWYNYFSMDTLVAEDILELYFLLCVPLLQYANEVSDIDTSKTHRDAACVIFMVIEWTAKRLDTWEALIHIVINDPIRASYLMMLDQETALHLIRPKIKEVLCK